MILKFNKAYAQGYKSKSQIVRVLSEPWLANEVYCPHCQSANLSKLPNNHPAADFSCPICNEMFEIKSKKGKTMGKTVTRAKYDTLIEKLSSNKMPHFFFLNYSPVDYSVVNLFIVPSYFITLEAIKKRSALHQTAKRKGWIGYNISLSHIPNSGRIDLIKNKIIIPASIVRKKWNRSLFLKNIPFKHKGWTLTILAHIDRLPEDKFSLQNLYTLEVELQRRYPKNNFIKEKIRQQLQILRDQGVNEFLGKGNYRKILSP